MKKSSSTLPLIPPLLIAATWVTGVPWFVYAVTTLNLIAVISVYLLALLDPKKFLGTVMAKKSSKLRDCLVLATHVGCTVSLYHLGFTFSSLVAFWMLVVRFVIVNVRREGQ